MHKLKTCDDLHSCLIRALVVSSICLFSIVFSIKDSDSDCQWIVSI